MGTLLSCDKCPPASTSTIFTFSEPLVLKINEGVEPEPVVHKEGQSPDLNDQEWMEKIECIDETHSHAYSLTEEGFNRIVGGLEKRLARLPTDVCQERLRECYIEHAGDTLKCSPQVKDFVDRIDLIRLKTIKEKFAGER